MATKLKVRYEYRNRELYYPAGTTIEVDAKMAHWLLADAPDCFQPIVDPEPKALEGPPANKMVRKPKAKKGTAGK